VNKKQKNKGKKYAKKQKNKELMGDEG